MTEKERQARELADILLDGGGDAWPATDILAFIANDGWVWDGQTWKQAERRPPNHDHRS